MYDAMEIQCIGVAATTLTYFALVKLSEVVKEAFDIGTMEHRSQVFFTPRRLQAMLVANLLCIASIDHTLDRHGKRYLSYPIEVVDAVANRGFEGILYKERPIDKANLKDLKTVHPRVSDPHPPRSNDQD